MDLQQKKSEQLKNKGVVLALDSHNTKTKSETLGDIELKYVSYGDTIEFAKILQEPLQNKDFVAKILFHQLVKPEVRVDDFQKLPDTEIEALAKVFVKNEGHTFKYFQDTGNYFKDFKQALATGHEKHIEELRKTFEPIVKSAQETLTAFSKNYASVIQQAIDGTSYIQESMRGLAEVAKQIGDTQRRFIESVKPAIEQYQSTAKIIAESLRPQIDFWQKWAEQNKKVFDNFSNYWIEFQQKYNIAEQKAVQILQKYKWFISPSMPINFVFEVVQLGQKKGRQDKAMNKLFVDYFSQNNWQNLEAITEDWEKNTLFKKRIKIIQDCVKILKNTDKKTNAVNVVLPTLIVQIDGFLTDYLDSKSISYGCAYDDFIDRKTGRVKKVGRKSQFRENSSKALTSNLYDLANDIFLNILFQRSQKGKPLKTPFNFNRHKIMHGENVNYGRNNYLIRSFLLIDFLVSLK